MRIVLRRPAIRRGMIAGCLAWACAAAAPTAHAQDDPPEQDKKAQDKKPARPPLPAAPPPVRLPWARHIEIGVDLALVARPASQGADGEESRIRYEPALGFGAHARWEIFRWLRFSAYAVGASHDLRIPPGSLGVRGRVQGAAPGEEAKDVTVETITFGARLAPTLPLSERARSWASIGIGYGRFDFPKMWIEETLGPNPVRERAMSFVEFPAGIGASFDIIRNWLAIELEITAAIALGQEGESVRSAQAIDKDGHKRSIGGLPLIDASIVQTLGLSLIL
jgi:hypothetical protein